MLKSIAEAKGYIKVALNCEEQNKKKYLLASACYLENSKTQDNILYNQMAHYLFLKALALKTKQEATNKADSKINLIKAYKNVKIGFDDICGLEEAKKKIKEKIIYPYEKPEIYKIYKRNAGGGILLWGPPGCGKTLIAEATAKEAKAVFFNIGISDVLSKWVGESEKIIANIFEQARKQPSVVFFDELDALGTQRNEEENSFTRRLTNTILSQIDGIGTKQGKILLLGATNRPWNIDDALRRPGRFDEIVFIGIPNNKTRGKIIQMQLKQKPISKDIDLDFLIKNTNKFSCADIVALCNDAINIPLTEALEGKQIRKINFNDFSIALKSRKSSIKSWFEKSKNEVLKTNNKDLFKEVFEF
ncbi:MAG: cell division protein [Candidatus Aenigmarchaeota archaeon ex4484_52]|nr:MAG: cell division protein [Candidatus Aenigmarchaeota archaeon ex4484_52]